MHLPLILSRSAVPLRRESGHVAGSPAGTSAYEPATSSDEPADVHHSTTLTAISSGR
jgi:hypothetical protein